MPLGRLETETRPHELEVVVDRLRHADHGDGELPPQTLLRHVARAAERAVAANAEEDVDVHPHERIDDDFGRLTSARTAEDRAAVLVDRVHGVGVEQERRVAAVRVEAGVAEADAVDGLDAVVEGEDLHDALDHVVEAGTQPARREDARARPAGVVEDLRLGAGALERRLAAELLAQPVEERHVLAHQDARAVGHELVLAHGRRDTAFAERVHVERIVLRRRRDLFQSR